jgi:hypothetical protein
VAYVTSSAAREGRTRGRDGSTRADCGVERGGARADSPQALGLRDAPVIVPKLKVSLRARGAAAPRAAPGVRGGERARGGAEACEREGNSSAAAACDAACRTARLLRPADSSRERSAAARGRQMQRTAAST